MPHKMFFVTDENPNDTTGGGGCVCDPQRQQDCKPPYAVFPGNDMENIASPHVVLSFDCALAFVRTQMREPTAAIPREQGYKPGPNPEPTERGTPSI